MIGRWRNMLQRLRHAADMAHVREIVVFLLVGGASTVFYIAFTTGLTWRGMRPSLAILCTLAVLMPPTYLAQRRFTFRSTRGHWAAFPRYVATQAVGNGMALVAAELFAEPIRNHPLIAFTIVALVVAVTNYGILKFWAFRGVD